jgi:hypothetical protein
MTQHPRRNPTEPGKFSDIHHGPFTLRLPTVSTARRGHGPQSS